MSVNKVILVGNVGKDPDIRYLDENTAVCKFPLATSEVYRNRSGERVEQTEWHNIVLWRGLAQVAEKFVKKGTQVFIEGRIKTRSYDDSNGVRKYITEIVGDNMQLLGRRPQDGDDTGYGSDNYGQGSGSQGSGAASSGSQQSGSDSGAPSTQQSEAGGGSSAAQQPEPGSGPQNDISGSGDEADDLPF